MRLPAEPLQTHPTEATGAARTTAGQPAGRRADESGGKEADGHTRVPPLREGETEKEQQGQPGRLLGSLQAARQASESG